MVKQRGATHLIVVVFVTVFESCVFAVTCIVLLRNAIVAVNVVRD